ncbi:MAG: thiopurine S-methyltransferase [Acidobacteriota bacterium]
MDPAFWHERWQQNRIGFHLEDVNPYLRAHWAGLGLPASARILVPLCGKSVDLDWLAAQGHQVLGVEISPLAVEAFFREHGLSPHVSELRQGLQRWQAGAISILCGDFMTLQAADLGGIDGVYDRAALIALPPARRPAYVGQLQRLAGIVPQLLITLEHDGDPHAGPPFSVPDEEVRAHYGANYRIERCERADILGESPKFREQGLARLYETVYSLRPC